MPEEKITLKSRKTFVFVDVSNIRYACRCSCGFDLNFKRFYHHLQDKYANLQEVRYYEGIASNDEKKQRYFQRLEKTGYTICSLERKSYTNEAKYADFECSECGTVNTVQVLPETTKLKSNVDVYQNVFITVTATPMTRTNNCLSVRLKNLRSELPNDMALMNIENIKEQISR